MKTYRINEIFYSLQGEGCHTGRAAVFVRFSGCNLKCPFCDTDFKAYREMTVDDIIAAVSEWRACGFVVLEMTVDDIIAAVSEWRACGFVVLTGGEPSLQVDESLIEALHHEGFYIAIETNGTCPLPSAIDWVTLSPKNCFVDRVRRHPRPRILGQSLMFLPEPAALRHRECRT